MQGLVLEGHSLGLGGCGLVNNTSFGSARSCWVQVLSHFYCAPFGAVGNPQRAIAQKCVEQARTCVCSIL